MLKTLFATTLFSLSLSAPINNAPKKAVIPNTAYGMYCFKETFEPLYDTSEDVFNGTFYNWNDIDDVEDLQLAKCYRYTAVTSRGYTNIRNFDYSIDGEYFEFSISFGEEFIFANGDLSDTFGVQDLNTDGARYVTLYFPTPIYMSDDAFKVFNSFFSGSPNSYVTYYNGYYNLGSTYATTNFYSDIYGNFVINNNLYTNLTLGYSTISAGGVGGSVVVYDNGYKIADRNILISNTLIPTSEYSIMSNRGTFTYVPPSETNSFGDLIFSIMDAPIYYLTSLFSFELFGIQFYVAFMSMLTLLLIVVVVRKII